MFEAFVSVLSPCCITSFEVLRTSSFVSALNSFFESACFPLELLDLLDNLFFPLLAFFREARVQFLPADFVASRRSRSQEAA